MAKILKKIMDSFIKQIRDYWVILFFLGGLVVGWATFNTRLTQAENDIRDLKQAVIEITNIRIQVERIDTSVEFIKQQVRK